MARLLFLGASVSQVPAIRFAREVGHEVVAVDGDAKAVAFRYATVARALDFTDIDGVTALGRELGVEGVLAVSSDRAVLPAAEVSARLGLPGVDVAVARAMTDKGAMRAALHSNAVPQPRFAVVSAGNDLGAAYADVPFPAVVKPVDSGGQRGVFRVGSIDELVRRLPEAVAFSRSGRVIVEEYLDGGELNGILVVRAGAPSLVTLSDRLRPGGLGFGVGWIHSFPSALPAAALDQAREVAFAAVRALGLREGIAFPQLIADGEGSVRIVEVAARIPAGQMADLVLHGTGINLFEVAIKQALGLSVEDASIRPAFTRPVAIRFLTASPGVLPLGTVSAIEGLDRVRASEGVLAADLYFTAGAEIGPLQVDADRRGYVIATADTPAAALETADAASHKLVVHTRPADRPAPVSPASERRWAFVGILAAIVAASGIVVFASRDKVRTALVLGMHVDHTLTPLCGCPHDAARVIFKLQHGSTLTVDIVNAIGRPVDLLVNDQRVDPGTKLYRWNGRMSSGRFAPDGLYRAKLVFPTLHRTLQLRGLIGLDRDPQRRHGVPATTGAFPSSQRGSSPTI